MTRNGTNGTLWIPSQLVTVLNNFGPVIRSHVVSFFGSDSDDDIDKTTVDVEILVEGVVDEGRIGGVVAVGTKASTLLPTIDSRRIVNKHHWIIMIEVVVICYTLETADTGDDLCLFCISLILCTYHPIFSRSSVD